MGIRMSIKKTEGILLRGVLNHDRPPVVRMYGSTIRFVQVCRYLGVYLDRNLTFLPHAGRQRDKLLAFTNKVKRVVAGKWGLNRNTLNWLYKGVFEIEKF